MLKKAKISSLTSPKTILCGLKYLFRSTSRCHFLNTKSADKYSTLTKGPRRKTETSIPRLSCTKSFQISKKPMTGTELKKNRKAPNMFTAMTCRTKLRSKLRDLKRTFRMKSWVSKKTPWVKHSRSSHWERPTSIRDWMLAAKAIWTNKARTPKTVTRKFHPVVLGKDYRALPNKKPWKGWGPGNSNLSRIKESSDSKTRQYL